MIAHCWQSLVYPWKSYCRFFPLVGHFYFRINNLIAFDWGYCGMNWMKIVTQETVCRLTIAAPLNIQRLLVLYIYGYYQSLWHYNGAIMGTIASQITSLTIVYSTVYSDADQRKHQSSSSLAFVRGIHWGPVNSQWPVTRKMFPFDDVIMGDIDPGRHWLR